MWKLCSAIALTGALFCAQPARAVERLATGTDVAATVSVQNVSQHNGVVTGTLVNKSHRLLHDVRLLIRHTWLWRSERAPRHDNPGRADFYTVPGEIPAGGSLTFTYRPRLPLPNRSDGHFETTAEVVSYTEVGE